VQGRVREHQIPGALVGEVGDVAGPEGEALAREGGGAREHLRRGIEPHRLRRLDPLVQHPGQLAGAAAQIDRAPARDGLDLRQQIEEGPAALVLEALVL
jgi:hypothetical protein